MENKSSLLIHFRNTIYVHNQHRGEVIGKLLMEKLINEYRQRKIHALIACITRENESSATFHKKLGFTQVSCFNEVGMKFGRRIDVTDYELILE